MVFYHLIIYQLLFKIILVPFTSEEIYKYSNKNSVKSLNEKKKLFNFFFLKDYQQRI